MKLYRCQKKYNIKIIEDAAQSIGSRYNNKPAGSFGEIGCFSAHPLKNLNAIGDGGYIVTNKAKIYKAYKDLINHGMTDRNRVKNFGYVSRMDTLQAAVLNFRLDNLNKIILKRRNNANIYFKNLDRRNAFIPQENSNQFNTYHTFVIQVKKRDQLKKYLLKNNVVTAIHYPIPIHLQPASKKFKHKKGDFVMTEKQSKQILTLPINQYLKKNEILRICNLINKFYD